ncbi:MAG: class I SAM-dependent methyltransferase [Verrucomicrobiota bacterium]
MEEAYQYEGLEASFYDVLDELADFDDYDFYRWFVAAQPGSVLDVGCGTGRIMVPLAREGFDVYGLDASQEMLDLCREKLGDKGEGRLFLTDMRQFDLGRKFGTVMVPGFSLQMLKGERELRACLESCRKHLESEGQLILSFYTPLEYLEDKTRLGGLEKRKDKKIEGTGERVVAYQGWKLDESSKRMMLENRYELIDPEGVLKRFQDTNMVLFWYEIAWLRELLLSLGFGSCEDYGDFTFEEYSANNECLGIVARV